MIQTIEIDEADGIGTYGGVPEDKWAGEVFIGGTKQRPLTIGYYQGDEDLEWDVSNITLFHPNETTEQIEWDALLDRMSYKEVSRMTDYICQMVAGHVQGAEEQRAESRMEAKAERMREWAEDATRETNP